MAIIETNSSAVELMQINVIVFIEQTPGNVFGSGRIGDEYTATFIRIHIFRKTSNNRVKWNFLSLVILCVIRYCPIKVHLMFAHCGITMMVYIGRISVSITGINGLIQQRILHTKVSTHQAHNQHQTNTNLPQTHRKKYLNSRNKLVLNSDYFKIFGQ